MKKIHLLILLCIIGMSTYRAQNNVNHPTIQDIVIVYKCSAQSSLNISQGIQANPTATITLKSNTTASVIHFKISDATTNAQIYQVAYNLGASTVTSGNNTLFQNDNGTVIISYAQAITVIPHKFEIWTEDGQQNTSTVLSLTR